MPIEPRYDDPRLQGLHAAAVEALVQLLRAVPGTGKDQVSWVLTDAAADMVGAPRPRSSSATRRTAPKAPPRKRHHWPAGTIEADGTLTTVCKNCGLVHRHGWFEVDGQVLDVEQWWTPHDRLVRVRPVLALGAPRTAPPWPETFDAVDQGGVPECPKDPAAWASWPA